MFVKSIENLWITIDKCLKKVKVYSGNQKDIDLSKHFEKGVESHAPHH